MATSAVLAQDAASLTLTVVDPSGAMVPEAEVTLTDTLHGNVTKVKTQALGYVIFDPLNPSDYTIEIVKAGFQTFRMENLGISLRDRRVLRLQLSLASAKATEVKVMERSEAPSSDAGLGITLDQQYIENLPANGRNVESLLLLTPGITSAAGGRGGNGFNSNGLRSNTNYFTLDGVSLNSGSQASGGGPGGRFPGGEGGGPISAGAGGATELITLDSLQEMRVQTSAFSPEFGRTPGAQVTMTSRGGTNNFHGSLFMYLRRSDFDSNDWFANAGGYGKGNDHQNRPGATFGGPLAKNKTFFFLSVEELKLTAPYTVISSVPDLATRRSVSTALRPFLNAFPLPNGPALQNGGAQYRAVLSNPSRSDSGSLRIDHALTSRINLFFRYSLNPSSSTRRGSDISVPNQLTHQSTHADTITAGMTRVNGGGSINDLRVNYSDSTNRGNTLMDNFGGAVPLTDATVFPKGVTSANGSFNLNILGFAGYSYGGHTSNQQRQANLVDTWSKVVGNHSFKLGVDFRSILQTQYHNPYSLGVAFEGLTVNTNSFTNGTALNGQVSSSLPQVYPTFFNASVYAQDTWRATDRTTLTYGLRWDVNPAPYARSGPKPFAISDSTIAGVTQNDPLYPTVWSNVAPRIGVSYLSDDKPGHEMTFRAGAGLFYDLGYGVVASAFGGAPYSSSHTVSPAKFPFATSFLTPPSLPPSRPYGNITAGQSGLVSPRIIQYSFTWEKFFGSGQMLNISYVGTSGANLMRTESRPTFSTAYELLRVVTNGGSSSYKGVQMQYRKRFSGHLSTQFSYTLAKSTDTASTDSSFGGGFSTIFGSSEKGYSDYDIRHNLSWSGSYLLPGPQKGLIGNVIGGWSLDWNALGRSALPFELSAVSSSTSATSTTSTTSTSATVGDPSKGLFAQIRPSTNGLPIWISDKTVPGGKKLNFNAFYIPTGYQQGNMARNSLRGFPFYQVDLALRKTITLTERFKLNLAAQGYNMFNHPNFANPSPLEGANLSSPNFGVVTRMVNQTFGGGLNSLFRSGGPRSMELSLRLQF